MVETVTKVGLSPTELERACVVLLEAAGAAPADADIVAHSIVEADLCGHASHGVLRIPAYLDEIRAHRIDVNARPRVVRQTGASILLDGAWGFGQVALAEGVVAALQLARTFGVGLVGIVRSNHCGRLGFWAERLADGGAWGLICTSYDHGPYEVAPYGGSSASLGTNPLAYAVPRPKGRPLIGDFATSEIAAGKLLVAQQLGQAAPEGALLNKDGEPTSRVADFFAGGALRAFGGHKGSALALLVDLLSVGLTDSLSWSGQRDEAFGAFVLSIRSDVFAPAEQVGARVEETAARVLSTRAIHSGHPVELPGDREWRLRASSAGGIELAMETWAALRAEAERLGANEVLEMTAQEVDAR
jgi:LDH2 family malate/lactate/ureidoglycolate dehydrogenase